MLVAFFNFYRLLFVSGNAYDIMLAWSLWTRAGHNTGCWGSQCSAYGTKVQPVQLSCTVTGSLAPELVTPGSTDSALARLVESCITILYTMDRGL